MTARRQIGPAAPQDRVSAQARAEVIEAERVELLQRANYLRAIATVPRDFAGFLDDVIDHLRRRGP
jgi:hypothetical protein